MQAFRQLSVVQQLAEHLREGLREGHWQGQLPGVIRLAAELGVAKNTLVAALRLVATEGLVALSQDGRSRHTTGKTSSRKRPLRIGILLHDSLTNDNPQSGQILFKLYHVLENAGFVPFFSEATQISLRHDVRRISRYISETPADAWVVAAGTRDVLEWFAASKQPCIALFGRRYGLPIAAVAPNKVPAYAAATNHLIALGHQRIVLVCRKLRRLPEPGRIERAFLAELAAHHLPVSDFNLPDWEESPEGIHRMLAGLFRITPPTAMIIDEMQHLIAVQQFLASRRLRVPEQVSLVTTDYDPSFAFCQPPVTHISWDPESIYQRVVRWATAVSKGRKDLVQTLLPAEFVKGGTAGPVWKDK